MCSLARASRDGWLKESEPQKRIRRGSRGGFVKKGDACFEHHVVVRPSLPVRVIILLLVRRRDDGVAGDNQDILAVG